MIAAAVVIVLVGMVIPIAMLLSALLFDVGLVAWVLLQEWHDHWSPSQARFANQGVTRSRRALRHRRVIPAH